MALFRSILDSPVFGHGSRQEQSKSAEQSMTGMLRRCAVQSIPGMGRQAVADRLWSIAPWLEQAQCGESTLDNAH